MPSNSLYHTWIARISNGGRFFTSILVGIIAQIIAGESRIDFRRIIILLPIRTLELAWHDFHLRFTVKLLGD